MHISWNFGVVDQEVTRVLVCRHRPQFLVKRRENLPIRASLFRTRIQGCACVHVQTFTRFQNYTKVWSKSRVMTIDLY